MLQQPPHTTTTMTTLEWSRTNYFKCMLEDWLTITFLAAPHKYCYNNAHAARALHSQSTKAKYKFTLVVSERAAEFLCETICCPIFTRARKYDAHVVPIPGRQ